MDRIILVNLAVLCVALLLCEVVLSASHYGTHQVNVRRDKGTEKKLSYLWFGPKQGRKKRNSVNEDLDLNVEREQLAALLDIVQDSPWALVAVNAKRHVVNFTPRLGRESGEEFNSGAFEDRWLQDSEASNELSSKRSPPFAPRLGRHLSPFSPRLGREIDKNVFA